MTSSIKEVGPVFQVAPEMAVRAAVQVIQHAKSVADAEMLMEMLGIDEYEFTMREAV